MSERLLVCGGRDYGDWWYLSATLDRIHAEREVSVLIHGAQRGADTLARNWAIGRHVPLQPFPADWRRHGKGAGPKRNQQMIDEGHPTLIVAFPGGNGTADMVRRGRKWDIEVIEAK